MDYVVIAAIVIGFGLLLKALIDAFFISLESEIKKIESRKKSKD